MYSINSGIAQGVAVAVGRYAEDTYYGGNPWYLNTFVRLNNFTMPSTSGTALGLSLLVRCR